MFDIDVRRAYIADEAAVGSAFESVRVFAGDGIGTHLCPLYNNGECFGPNQINTDDQAVVLCSYLRMCGICSHDSFGEAADTTVTPLGVA